jgi:hypothetical protein
MTGTEALGISPLISAVIFVTLYFATYLSLVCLLPYWRNWCPPTRASSLMTAGLAHATIVYITILPTGLSWLTLVLETGFIAYLFSIIAAPAIAFRPSTPRPRELQTCHKCGPTRSRKTASKGSDAGYGKWMARRSKILSYQHLQSTFEAQTSLAQANQPRFYKFSTATS